MINYVNYSDHNFSTQQNYAAISAITFGKVKSLTLYGPPDIDFTFRVSNKRILDENRGAGLWLWKPYFIFRKLKELKNNEYLLYSDSGAVLLKPVTLLLEELELTGQDLAAFELPLIEKQWTKQVLLDNLNCNSPKFADSNQRLSSFHFIKKTSWSMDFYKEYLDHCCVWENISDDYCGVVNSVNFIDHRHDQSIFSLLTKIAGLKSMKDPSQLGEHPTGYAGQEIENLELGKLYTLPNGRLFRANNFPQKYSKIFFHSRQRNPLYSYTRYNFARLLKHLKIYRGIIR